jgi:hypothetical protein
MDERTNGRTTDPTVCLDRAQDGSNATDEHERWTDEREESVGTVERETVESTERVRCVRGDDAGTRERERERGDGATTTRPGMDARVRVCFHVHRRRSIARVVDETDRAVVDEDATGAPGRARGGRNAPAEGETIDD